MTDTGKPVWLEVAINGPWSRDLQPLAPRSDDAIIADGIACAGAGASIIHLHIFKIEIHFKIARRMTLDISKHIQIDFRFRSNPIPEL